MVMHSKCLNVDMHPALFVGRASHDIGRIKPSESECEIT